MATPMVLPATTTSAPSMTEEQFRVLRAYIYEQTGIYFQDNKKYLLEGRLAKRLHLLDLSSYDEYITLIKYSPRRAEETRFLYDAITINETFFFRNEPQFEAFEKTIVPSLLAQKQGPGRPKLRVWSAATSSGEEAYTIAMVYLEKLKPRYPNLEIEIIGTDISTSMIETARRGTYRDYSIRNMPDLYLKKYFVVADGRYHLRDDVKRLARFEQLNLIDAQRMKQMVGFDVIFCCNVLIYFDTNSKIQVVSSLYNSLTRGGALFIGYAESLHGISTAFRLVNFPKTIAYRKE